jgi:Fe-S-cluster containining protein
MKNGKAFPIPVKVKYSCDKCPAYCCSYPEIEVTPRDIERLAKFDPKEKVRLLRHQKDRIFDSVCALLDQKTRRCTVYHARPAVCREYPDSKRCGYYEFLKFERAHQDDPKFIALT